MTGVSMRNCRFDSARCTDWRIWSTDVSACTFVGADLSRSALGAWSREGRGSTFRDTSFRSSKLSSIVSRAGHFEDCDFTDVTLRNVDFGSSGFVRCRFSGELTKVIFWDHGFKTGKPEPNRMIDVDFSQAHFREVEFRRLNLDRVTLPVSDDHMIVNHYRCVLAKTIERLSVDNHPDARAFKVFMEVMMKWVGPRQQIGIFAKSDFDVGGDSTYIIGLLREAENECQNSSGLRKRFRRG